MNTEKPFSPNGMFNLFAYGGHFEAPSATYIGASEEPIEFIGYPHIGLGKSLITLQEEKQDYRISEFSGTVKVYDFDIEAAREMRILGKDYFPDFKFGVLALRLNDQCAAFETTILFDYRESLLSAAHKFLNELKSEVIIKRTKLGEASQFSPESYDPDGTNILDGLK